MIDLKLCLETVDYWYDVGFFESQRRLIALTDVEWAELVCTWQAQPIEWQERLAYILGDENVPREIELLTKMSASEFKEVAFTASEALRGNCERPCA